MAGIITDEIIAHVGRPRNNIKYCKVCGVELTFENTRETRTGSGSLRSTCRECEREKDRAKHKAKYRKKHKRNRVSRGPAFIEMLNRRRMAAQKEIIIRKKDGKYVVFYEDKICEECGGIIRYDEDTLERICEQCGLIDESPDSDFISKLIKKDKRSKYKIINVVNRDKTFDIQAAENNHPTYDRYQPAITGGTYDKYYAACYKGSESIDVINSKPNVPRLQNRIYIKLEAPNNLNFCRKISATRYEGENDNLERSSVINDDLRSRIIETKKRVFPNKPELWFVNYPGEIDLNGNMIS